MNSALVLRVNDAQELEGLQIPPSCPQRRQFRGRFDEYESEFGPERFVVLVQIRWTGYGRRPWVTAVE